MTDEGWRRAVFKIVIIYFTIKYYCWGTLVAERIRELSKYDAATARLTKKTFQATNGKYERQLKRDLRGEEDK